MADEEEKKKKQAAEEQKRKEETEKAQAELQGMLQQSKPKHAGEGLVSGVGTIVGAAVGAAGVIVLVPTVSGAAGLKQAGLLGGVLGLAGGAVVGVLGGAAVAVGGTLMGVGQVVRGVIATPAAIISPSQGKWWNSLEGKWVYTELPKDANTLDGIPDDDMDILGEATEAAEAGAKTEITGDVVDTYYYDVLGVGPTAEPSAIKRKYYVLARKYHPDRVDATDAEAKKEAADKFKEIAEAYQVLSDPELRAKYDKDGRDGLSADKTEVADGVPKIDPGILFAFLFGSDKFHSYVGRLAVATSASIGDAPTITKEQAATLQKRRVLRLAIFLADKLDAWTEDGEVALRAEWVAEAEELSKASYGSQMVHLIGQIYTLSAELFLGSLESRVGMVSLRDWASSRHARIKQTGASNKNKIETIKAGLEAVQIQQKIAKEMQEAKTEEEKKALEEKLAEEMSGTVLKIMWTTSVIDITNTLHEATRMVMFDQSIGPEDRKRRALNLKALGEIFENCPEPEEEDEKDAKQLYEEAAFAAMVETIKRKEESQGVPSN